MRQRPIQKSLQSLTFAASGLVFLWGACSPLTAMDSTSPSLLLEVPAVCQQLVTRVHTGKTALPASGRRSAAAPGAGFLIRTRSAAPGPPDTRPVDRRKRSRIAPLQAGSSYRNSPVALTLFTLLIASLLVLCLRHDLNSRQPE